MAIILIFAAFLLIRPMPFIIIITSIVGILILASRIFFKQLAIEHPEAFNLLIAIVSVIIGVYLGITANQNANDKEEKRQLIKLINSTKRDVEECFNKLQFEKDNCTKTVYYNDDKMLVAIRKTDLRHTFEAPAMYDFLINSPSTVKFLPPEIVRKILSINYFIKQLMQHLNTCFYPGLKEYHNDINVIMNQLKQDLQVMQLMIDYLILDKSSEKDILIQLEQFKGTLVPLYIPVDTTNPVRL
jgi:hypothetical protein